MENEYRPCIKLIHVMTTDEILLFGKHPETNCKDLTLQDLSKLSYLFGKSRVTGSLEKNPFTLHETASALGYDLSLLKGL